MTAPSFDGSADALDALADRSGATLVTADWARAVATALDVDLDESLFRPLRELDRLQPDNDTPAVSVGNLVVALADAHDLDPDRPTMLGHGSTARKRKAENLPALRSAATAA